MATEGKEPKARLKEAAPPAHQQGRKRNDEAIIIRIDGRTYRRGAQTNDPERAKLMRAWIQDMKRGEYGGMDTLRHIIAQNVALGEAYDRREAPAKVKAMGGQRNIEPLVDEWFAWKSDPQRKRGQKSAGEYRKQVRKWIVKGKPFLLSQCLILSVVAGR